ncbi:MAG: 1-deoxy-D-xylulose-5-phosphate reductoisomerase [Gemmatimonadales bacterium]
MKGVAILGSTGSIGTSALRVIERQRERFRVVALTAYGSAEMLEEQIAASGATFGGLVNGGPGASDNGLMPGPECLVEAATHPDADIVLNAVVGAAGLQATLAALKAGKRVALANKETLVMAGDLVKEAARQGGGEIVPIDSEHSAVLQCVVGRPHSEMRRLILTASGGPFREWPADKLHEATVEEAMQHPTWNMGPKITVDSATLANKALEVIEAHHLFELGYDAIEVVVHPQSIIHAFTEFVDGSVLAQVGFPTMELPILYALTYPDRVTDATVGAFDPVEAGPLTFEPLRRDDFPSFELGVEAGRSGQTYPAVFNATNEVAVAAFLEGKIQFGQIPEVVRSVLDDHEASTLDLESVLAADRWARVEGETRCSQ